MLKGDNTVSNRENRQLPSQTFVFFEIPLAVSHCDLIFYSWPTAIFRVHTRPPLNCYGPYGMDDSVSELVIAWTILRRLCTFLVRPLHLHWHIIWSIKVSDRRTQMISNENIQYNRILVLKIRMAKMNKYRWWLVKICVEITFSI